MPSTYVGYFTGKQCWCDSSGAFFKWLRHSKSSHARAKKCINGTRMQGRERDLKWKTVMTMKSVPLMWHRFGILCHFKSPNFRLCGTKMTTNDGAMEKWRIRRKICTKYLNIKATRTLSLLQLQANKKRSKRVSNRSTENSTSTVIKVVRVKKLNTDFTSTVWRAVYALIISWRDSSLC